MYCVFQQMCMEKVIRRRVMAEKNQSSMLLITTEDRIVELTAKLRHKDYRDYKISAIYIEELTDANNNIIEADMPIIYGKNSLLEYVRQNVVDDVFIDVCNSKEQLTELSDIFLQMGIVVHIGMGYLG